MGTWDHDIPPGYPLRPGWASDGTYQAVPPVGLRNPASIISLPGLLAIAGLGYLAYRASKSKKAEDLAVFLDVEPNFSLNGVNYDYPQPMEGQMAQSYLRQLEQDAAALRQGLNPDDNLPSWVNSYIATSADRMQTASRYMQHKFQESDPSTYGDYGLFWSSGATAADIVAFYGKYGVTDQMAGRIVSAARAIGIPDPAMLANVIRMESSFSPKIQNTSYYHDQCGGGYATGLLQFTPCTANELGTTVAKIKNMNFMDQMDLVEKYFRLPRITMYGPLRTQVDVMMAVFYPKAIGNPRYRFPSDVSAANKGITTPLDYLAMAEKNGLMPYTDGLSTSSLTSWIPDLNPLHWLQRTWYSGLLGKVAIVGGVALTGVALMTAATGGALGYSAYKVVRKIRGNPWIRGNPETYKPGGQYVGVKGQIKGFDIEAGGSWSFTDLAVWGLVGLGSTIVGSAWLSGGAATAGTGFLAAPLAALGVTAGTGTGMALIVTGLGIWGVKEYFTSQETAALITGTSPKQLAMSNPMLPPSGRSQFGQYAIGNPMWDEGLVRCPECETIVAQEGLAKHRLRHVLGLSSAEGVAPVAEEQEDLLVEEEEEEEEEEPVLPLDDGWDL